MPDVADTISQAAPQVNIADLLTKATIATEGLLPGQTPFRITSDAMRKWKTIHGIPIDKKAKVPDDRKNFIWVAPEMVEPAIKTQWQKYFNNPGNYGLDENDTLEAVVKKFDQTNPQNKLRLLIGQGVDPKLTIKDIKHQYDLSLLQNLMSIYA